MPTGTTASRGRSAGTDAASVASPDVATAFGGPVSTISSFNVGRGEARVVVSVAPGAKQEVVREGRTVPTEYVADFSKPLRDAVNNSAAAAEGARAFAEKRRPSWVARA